MLHKQATPPPPGGFLLAILLLLIVAGCDQQSSLVEADVAPGRSAVQSDLTAASETGVRVILRKSNDASVSTIDPEQGDVQTVSGNSANGATPMLIPDPCDPKYDLDCDEGGGGGGGGGGNGDCGPDDPNFHWVMGTDVDNMGVYTNYTETQSYTGSTVQVYYLWVGHEVWVDGVPQGYFTEDIYCDVNTNYYVGWTDPSGLQSWEAEGTHEGQSNLSSPRLTFQPTYDQDYL